MSPIVDVGAKCGRTRRTLCFSRGSTDVALFGDWMELFQTPSPRAAILGEKRADGIDRDDTGEPARRKSRCDLAIVDEE